MLSFTRITFCSRTSFASNTAVRSTPGFACLKYWSLCRKPSIGSIFSWDCWRPRVARFPRDIGSQAGNRPVGKTWAPSRYWWTSAASPRDSSHPTHCRCGEEWHRHHAGITLAATALTTAQGTRVGSIPLTPPVPRAAPAGFNRINCLGFRCTHLLRALLAYHCGDAVVSTLMLLNYA